MYEAGRSIRALLVAAILGLVAHSKLPAQPMPAAQPAPPAANPVQALLDTKPSTPEELVNAISLLIDFKQPALAKPYLEQLLGANLDDAALAELGKRFGTPVFTKIAIAADLKPEGAQFADAVMAAYQKQAQDPARLAGLIAQLQDPTAEVRRRAAIELRTGGIASVEALLAVLCDAGRAAEHANARTALVGQGRLAIAPTIAALQAPQAAIQVQAIEVLRRLQASDFAAYLLAPALAESSPPEVRAAAQQALTGLVGRAPNQREASSTLYSLSRQRYEQSLAPTSGEPQEVWSWNARENKPAATLAPPQVALLTAAARLARDLYTLMPQSPVVRRLYLGTLLESAAHAAGLDQPLPMGEGTAFAEAAAAGVSAVEDLLADSMRTGHVVTAIAAAQVLAEIGTTDLLYNRGAQPAVIVEAANHPEARLRYAALVAIVKWQPPRPYPGSSMVVQNLAWAASSSGARRVLAIDTQPEEARRLASLLAAQGFEGDVALHPRDVLPQLTASSDYELVLVDFLLAKANVDELIQQIRRDPRTALVPIGLVTEPADQLRANRIALRDPRVQVIIRPVDAAAMEFQALPLLERTSPLAVPVPERLAHTQQAIVWLGQISASPQTVYNLSVAADAALGALATPGLTQAAAPLVADLGLPRAQVALVNLASQPTRTLEDRQAAAEAFRRSVERFGILLTSQEMLQQYERYNQSEKQPPESQALLSHVLDTLESRRPMPPEAM
jgi:CheY-like chemotaxis protein